MAQELLTSQPDLLVVLGKNIGIGSSPADIRADELHLSLESCMAVVAAGALYRPGTDIIFSEGHTAGAATPSGAEAMRDYFQSSFPSIPETVVELEEISIDTASNAEVIHDMISGRSYNTIGLVSTGYHIDNVATLFGRYEVPFSRTYASEKVLESHDEFTAFVAEWRGLSSVRAESLKEKFRGFLLHTVDPKGHLLRQITQRSRPQN